MDALPSPPPGWGSDPLTAFLDNTRLNEFATFANREAEFTRLKEIDQIYRDFISALLNAPELLSNFLILRTHSSYLGGCRLTLSGQVIEAYPVLRASLESALYAFFMSGSKSRQEIWLHRDDNETAAKKFRKTFTARAVSDHLKQRDPQTGEMAQTLYERAISYGAHPNRDSILTVLQQTQQTDRMQFKLNYLVGDGGPLQFALRTSAQVGLCGLRTLRNIYAERFDIMGFTERISSTSVGF